MTNLVRDIAMYTKQTAPFGHNDSTIEFDVTIDLKTPPFNGKSVEVILFLNNDDVNGKIGKVFNGEDRACCFTDQYLAGSCTTLGRTIIDPVLFTAAYSTKFFYWGIVPTECTLNPSRCLRSYVQYHRG